jgi:hypothetical protein
MEFKKVTELLELLLIKKNNFSINEDEKLLIEELVYLLVNNKDSNEDDLFECQCEFNSEAIEKEIEMNQCSDCGLPLTIL